MAQRIQLKRSSIAGRRPDGSYLEPGELALNSNASDPGLFFEANDGSIIKAGPTAIGVKEPETAVGYGQGEAWYDDGNGTFNIYSAEAEKWFEAYSTPYGGSTTLLYVGSQFPEASDDLSNDGRAKPFATLNRACIEIARRSILQNRADDTFAEQFVIMLLPGTNVVYNEPGKSLAKFEEDHPIFQEDQVISLDALRGFNPESGGLLLPRGTSITSFDMRKTLIRPTYYPKWTRETYEDHPDQLNGRTNILKWTGGSEISHVTFRDKREEVSVFDIQGGADEPAILESIIPHGFRTYVFNAAGTNSEGTLVENPETICDTVSLVYPDQVSQTYEGNPVVAEGKYLARPIDATRFMLVDPVTNDVLIRRQLPFAPDPGTEPKEFLSLTYQNTSHHRLTALGFATELELANFYSKVQRAFSAITFGGRINDANVAVSEVEIVTPLPKVAIPAVNDTTHTAPQVYHSELRSNYGMSGIICDGSLVGGLKSVTADNFSYFSFQNDPDVYEVYYDSQWLSLKEATWRAYNLKPQQVTDKMALEYRIAQVELPNLRQYYRSSYDISDKDDKSSGLTDELSDTRSYSVLALNSGRIRLQSCTSLGPAVHYWSKAGGFIASSNSSTIYGGQALRSEGFTGIGTGGGADDENKGFTIKGIRRPVNVHFSELTNPNNHKFLYLNGNIVAKTSTSITMSEPINTRALFPYTLRPGSVIWVADITTSTLLKATIAENPLSEDLLTLKLESNGNEIAAASLDDISPPFIRRFVDPRPDSYRTYSLWVDNTSTGHNPPTPGNILRFAERSVSKVNPLLRPGKQLDPGLNGGWNHLFAIHDAYTKTDGNNPNIAYPPSITPNPAENYYISLRLCDSFTAWDDTSRYDNGSYVTYLNKPYASQTIDVGSPYDVPPPDVSSTFGQSKTYEFCQPVEDAFQSESTYGNAEDPRKDDYKEGDTYARGLSVSNTNYIPNVAIDYDDGTENLGLKGTGDYANFVNPAFIDPDYLHTKLAIKRFLVLLGYEATDVDVILQPQRWSNRNLPVTSFPELTDQGYALSTGEWPIEFNVVSSIDANAHLWEASGYGDYSKGLDRYRQSPLSTQMRFDNISIESWGGIVKTEGLTDAGEFVTNRLAQVTGAGQHTRPQLNTGDSVVGSDPTRVDNGLYVPSVF